MSGENGISYIGDEVGETVTNDGLDALDLWLSREATKECQKNRIAVVTGAPGSGKTYLTRMFTHQLMDIKNESGSLIPLYLDIKNAGIPMVPRIDEINSTSEDYRLSEKYYKIENIYAKIFKDHGLCKDKDMDDTAAGFVAALKANKTLLIIDHYEFLEEIFGRKGMYVWEKYNLAHAFIGEKHTINKYDWVKKVPEGKKNKKKVRELIGTEKDYRFPRIIINCDKSYYESRKGTGIFDENIHRYYEINGMRKEDPKYDEACISQLKYLKQCENEWSYFFPDSQRLIDVKEEIGKLKTEFTDTFKEKLGELFKKEKELKGSFLNKSNYYQVTEDIKKYKNYLNEIYEF
ncbi:hypothetical protein ACFL1H_03065 [Nanoarchaeota archaeon]